MSRRTKHNGENWPSLPLGDIADISAGGTPSRKEKRYWNGTIPWITTGKISFNVIHEADEFITPEGLKNSSARIFPKNTILLALIGQGATRGQVARLGIDAATNQNCVGIVPSNRVYAPYLFHYLANQYGEIRRAANNASVSSLNAATIRKLRVPLPGLKVQRQIGDLFDEMDYAISRLERLRHAKKRLSGMVVRRMAVASASRGSDESWSEWTLGALFSERAETHRPGLKLLSVTASRGLVARGEIERKDTSNVDKAAYLRVVPGDIAYNTMRMWQGVSALSSLEGIVSPAYTVCIPGPEIDGEFAAALFKLPSVIDLFRRHSQGLVDDTLSLKFEHFAQIRLRIPPIEEQRKIARAVRVMNREIALLERLRDRLEVQKRALLDRLLTGQLRLPNAE